jgi:hypothetical protein
MKGGIPPPGKQEVKERPAFLGASVSLFTSI